jgi:hypothetical protein
VPHHYGTLAFVLHVHHLCCRHHSGCGRQRGFDLQVLLAVQRLALRHQKMGDAEEA